jgi:hypothetical protein
MKTHSMKTHSMMIPLLALALAASACVGEAESGDIDDVAPGDVASAEQEIVAAPMTAPMTGAMIWPMSSITWDGMIGTWPIAVWAPSQLDFIVFNLGVFTDLTLTVGTMDVAGVFTPLPGVTAIPITNPTLTAITAGLTTPTLGVTTPLLPSLPIGSVNVATPIPLVPTVTSSALMLTGLPLLDGMSPLIINVSFNAANAASIASLSVFAAQAQVEAQAAMIGLKTSTLNLGLSNPALTSMIFPITAPFLGAPVTVSPIVMPPVGL